MDCGQTHPVTSDRQRVTVQGAGGRWAARPRASGSQRVIRACGSLPSVSRSHGGPAAGRAPPEALLTPQERAEESGNGVLAP